MDKIRKNLTFHPHHHQRSEEEESLIPKKGNKPQYKNTPHRSSTFQANKPGDEYPDRFIVSNIPDKSLPTNAIHTTKYTLLTFIPKNLYEQFCKPANLYFLIIGVLECIRAISPSEGQPLIYVPLSIIIAISATKDLFEDLSRKKDDSRENNSITRRLTSDGFKECRWEQLRVGDIIKVENGEYIPADIILLKTGEPNGGCYIETKNLDGETNLKPKKTDNMLAEYFHNESDLWKKNVEVRYEKQNPNLYSFSGNIKLSESQKVPLDNKNLVLRACSLRSSYAIGLVAYSGHQTKIMLNSVSARPKSSKVERLMNKELIIVFVVQGIWCLLSAIYSTIWFQLNKESLFSHLDSDEIQNSDNNAIYFLERFGSWIILFTNFVPISLLVTLELVKFIQAHVIQRDKKMIDGVIHTKASVQTSSLMEELGQVSHIFSDKTGTLTCNIMEFKKISIAGQPYGNERDLKDAESKVKVTNVDFLDQKFFDVIEKSDDKEHNNVNEMAFLLATCHSATVETRDDVQQYSASSPDDIAIVNFAKLCGYEYTGTSESNEIMLKIKGKEAKVKLFHMLEFTSDRKMMSVIIENDKKEYLLYSKGADSAIIKKAAKGDNPHLEATKKAVHTYASEGLRTLLLAKRVIPKDEYLAWSKKYEDASCAVENRDNLMAECEEEIEKELIVLGSTAIEDKLQDKVDETIAVLKKGGIKVWVLTGDKTETAINIGYSCKLLDDNHKMFIIDVENENELAKRLTQIAKDISKNKLGEGDKHYAVVITGQSLVDAFNPDVRDPNTDKLFKILSKAEAVLGCRVSPKQKRDVVELVKRRNPQAVTLAIGDGANDVNMITAAHVGVGIKGLEGYQAARASDFAIGEFKILRRLLLFYGRETYRKNSNLILYNFFKNIVLILPHFWFGFYNGMSGTILYEPMISELFNLAFASLPIIVYAIFDQEFEDEFLETHPEYYTPCIHDNFFNYKLFWYWFGSATIQSFFITMTAIEALETSSISSMGQNAGYWNSGMMILSSVVVCINLKILLFSYSYNFLMGFCLVLSMGAYVLTFYLFNTLASSPIYAEFGLLYKCWYFYFGTFLMLTLTTMMDSAITKYLNEKRLAKDQETLEQLKKQAHHKDMIVDTYTSVPSRKGSEINITK